MNAIVPFNFGDLQIRVEDREGQPWFVLADVCIVLGHSNPSVAASRLDDDERAALNITDPIGRMQETTVISESGLWSLVLTSRKPKAKEFKKWVTSEVLPTLRRKGSYNTPLPRDPRELLSYIQQQAGDMVDLQDENARLAPKAAALDRLSEAEGAIAPTHAAKAMGVSPNRLFEWLKEHKWLYSSAEGLAGYQDKIDAGLVKHVSHPIGRHHQPPKFVNRALLTPKGIAKLTTLCAGRQN